MVSFSTVIMSGVMITDKLPRLSVLTPLAYSLFDAALSAVLVGALFTFYARIVKATVQKTSSIKFHQTPQVLETLEG